jgi:hypothetical protein
MVPWTPIACVFMLGANFWWTREFVGLTVGVFGFGFIVEYQRKTTQHDREPNK